MKTWSFYRAEDGFFTRGTYSATDDKFLAANTPNGCVAMLGEFDSLCQCVDLADRRVIDYQPPRPSDDHEWIGKRWVLTEAAQVAINLDRDARRELAALDLQAQRYVAESVAGIIDDIGRRRLADILARKVELRRNIRHG